MKYLMFSLGLVVSITICLPLAQGGMVRDGLVANWSFDQTTVSGKTIQDLAGNYDATMEGDPKIIPGKYGQAIEFDGAADYVDLGILEGVGSQLGKFSMEFWIKTEITPDWTTFFKTLTDGLSMGWGIDLNRTAAPAWAYVEGNTHFYVRGAGGNALGAEIDTSIYDNKWHHISWVVADATSDTCQIYVDGESQEIAYAVVGPPAEFIDFQHPVYLGAANNRGAIERYCPAVVDEFRIYSRPLTEQEVLQNIASGAAVENSGKLSITWGILKDMK